MEAGRVILYLDMTGAFEGGAIICLTDYIAVCATNVTHMDEDFKQNAVCSASYCIKKLLTFAGSETTH